MTCFTFQPTLEAYSFAPTTVAQAQATEEVKTSARRIELKPATPRRQKVKSTTTAPAPVVPSEPAPKTQVKEENKNLPRTFGQSYTLFQFTGVKSPNEDPPEVHTITREDASILIEACMKVVKAHPEGAYLTDAAAIAVAKKYKFFSEWVARGCCLGATHEIREKMEGTWVERGMAKAKKPRRQKVEKVDEEELRMKVMRNAMVADLAHLQKALAALVEG